MEPLLTNSRIKLRALEAEDLDFLYKWENDTSMWEMSSAIAPFSRKQIWDYINTYDGNIFTARQLRFMIVECGSGNPVGMIDLYEFDPVNRRAYVGIMISSEFRNEGFGTEALALLGRYCRTRLGMHQLAAEVECSNDSSLKLFDNAGFKICGRLRSWLRRGESYNDIFLLQKMLQDV